jgi:hypothetical protein
MLKLQVRSAHGIRQIHWQGDTQALSLTSPAKSNSSDGWSVIMPAWDDSEGATNRWHLSAVVEDEKGQRVSSNEITLTWCSRWSHCLTTTRAGSCCRRSNP